MTKVVRLNESELFNIVSKVLNKRPIEKRKETFIEKLDNLLEFHIKLHKGLYNVNGDSSELKKKQNDYINNLFPYNHKVIKESRNRFSNKLLTESDDNYIIEFFGFIRENFINEYGKKTLTEQQSSQQQRTQLAKQAVIPLAQSLVRAFDGWGTDEELAVQTIKKIKSKEEVYELDLLLKSWKKGSLKDYINGDMSDFDSTEYRAIWSHLGKFGVTGANYNNFLAGIGKVVNAIGAGWKWLKEKGISWLFDQIRGFLNSGWGQAAQLFLDSFGVGAIGVVAVWGLMTVWDLLNINTGGWVNFALSAFSLLTAGAMAPILGPVANVLKKVTGSLDDVLKALFSSKFGSSFKAWIPKIMSGVSKVTGWIGSGVNWIVSKFSSFLPTSWVTALQGAIGKCTQWISSLVKKINVFAKGGDKLITKTITAEAGQTIISKTLGKLLNGFPGLEKLMGNPQWAKTFAGKLDKPTAKLLDEYIVGNAKTYGWDKVRNGICKSRGEQVCGVLDKVAVAYKIKAHGGESIHHSKDSLNDVKRGMKGSLKNIKGKKMNSALLKGQKAFNSGKETYGLASGEEGEEGAEA